MGKHITSAVLLCFRHIHYPQPFATMGTIVNFKWTVLFAVKLTISFHTHHHIFGVAILAYQERGAGPIDMPQAGIKVKLEVAFLNRLPGLSVAIVRQARQWQGSGGGFLNIAFEEIIQCPSSN